MRTLGNKNYKKIYIIVAIALLVLAGTTVAALFVPFSPFAINKDGSDKPENTVNYDKPTDEQKEAGNQAKEDFIKEHENNEASVPSDGSSSTVVGVSIATFQQGSTLQIRTIIESVDVSGSCTLTLSRTGYENLVRSAQTQSQGSYSVCQGFDIDVSSLEAGSWMVTVDFAAQGKSGTTQKVVELQ